MPPFNLHLQTGFQGACNHLDLPPDVDQCGPGVHPIGPVLPGDRNCLLGLQVDGHERHGLQAGAGLDERQRGESVGIRAGQVDAQSSSPVFSPHPNRIFFRRAGCRPGRLVREIPELAAQGREPAALGLEFLPDCRRPIIQHFSRRTANGPPANRRKSSRPRNC